MRPALGVQATVRVRGFADPEGRAVPAPGARKRIPQGVYVPTPPKKGELRLSGAVWWGSGGLRTAAHNAVYIQRPLRGVLLLRRLAGRQR